MAIDWPQVLIVWSILLCMVVSVRGQSIRTVARFTRYRVPPSSATMSGNSSSSTGSSTGRISINSEGRESMVDDTGDSDADGDPRAILDVFSSRRLQSIKECLERQDKCPTCWLKRPLCMCSKIRDIFERNDKIKSNVALLMHSKEYGRASNTGKIMRIGLGEDKVSLAIFGSRRDEAELERQLTTSPSIILYPGVDSVDISTYKDWFIEHTRAGRSVNLCVIDSTWPQSQAMNKALPASIPRVVPKSQTVDRAYQSVDY
jgi:DTW domain-containing protein YfiP